MRQTRVVQDVWDDLHLKADDKKVPASMSAGLHAVVYNEDGQIVEAANVELDLTSDHAAAFWSSIRLWAEAGSPVKPVQRSAARAAVRPSASAQVERYASGKRKVVPPLEKLCPFAPSTEARRMWLDDLRQWAIGEGREADFHQPSWDGESSTKYHYPKQLILDFMGRPSYNQQKYLKAS